MAERWQRCAREAGNWWETTGRPRDTRWQLGDDVFLSRYEADTSLAKEHESVVVDGSLPAHADNVKNGGELHGAGFGDVVDVECVGEVLD
jgi:hypothetical protein